MNTSLPADVSNQKLRGGYYTPGSLAHFLASWAVRSPADEVLEPSCGDGVLLAGAVRRLLELGAPPEAVNNQVQAVELYESEARTAVSRVERMGVAGDGIMTIGDFFEYDDQSWGIIGRRFDVVIGNPPFLRYHSFPDEQRERAFRIMRTAGLNPNKLTNSWVPFLVAASLRLKSNGRLAMVIPAELLQVKYAEETRAFLAKHFGALTIMTFRRLVFDGIQQEVVLLLAEKRPEIESGIDVIELEDAHDLADYEVTLREKHHLKSIVHAEEKWTQYYLDQDEIALLRQAKLHPGLMRFGQLGCVDVGVVTGNNSFFVMNEEQARKRDLQEHVLPLVGRTAQLPGLAYTEADRLQNREMGVLCQLLNLPPVPFDELPKAAQEYVRAGEREGVHTGFKCRNRKLWYIVPSLWVPDAFLFRQIHVYPKLVWNRVAATSTDTIHRVRYHHPQYAEQITLSFMNSLTFAFSEVIGRSYGGGVLELEPNEAELVPVPFFNDLSLDFAEIDCLERSGKIETILELTDNALLRQRLSFDAREVMMFRQIWRKLSGRRLGRKTRIRQNGS
jgi:adenine-specific DNA-methyltransferase